MTTETSQKSRFCHPDPEMSGYYNHVVGNTNCQVGWCGGLKEWFPRSCPNCDGLVHADFGDESSDGCYWLHMLCDKCGERFYDDDF